MSKARNQRRRAKAKAVKLLKKLTPEQRQQLIDEVRQATNDRP
jgi:Spy/CpxP family protein refolding chaperone